MSTPEKFDAKKHIKKNTVVKSKNKSFFASVFKRIWKSLPRKK